MLLKYILIIPFFLHYLSPNYIHSSLSLQLKYIVKIISNK